MGVICLLCKVNRTQGHGLVRRGHIGDGSGFGTLGLGSQDDLAALRGDVEVGGIVGVQAQGLGNALGLLLSGRAGKGAGGSGGGIIGQSQASGIGQSSSAVLCQALKLESIASAKELVDIQLIDTLDRKSVV